VQTLRVHRTWLDKLLLWQQAYQTKILDQHREVVGRGRTPETSQEAEERRWIVRQLIDVLARGRRSRTASLPKAALRR
jgi:hypothetical protein